MAQDPYGFPDAAPGEGAPAGAATTALWAGTAALICGLLGPCTCYTTYLAALPLSIVALYFGSKGMASAVEAERSASAAGLVGGGVSLLFSLLFLAGIALYVAFVIFIAAAGNL
ncbi:MAG: hypothetical protein ACOZNI_26120 [Myxococcota bacterium]